MAVHVIRMPDIGEGIAEVELVAWRVKAGNTVSEDQVLAEVMTDKATVEIPSPVSGTVLALGGEVGQVMAVGSELIRIEIEGAEPAEAMAAKAAAREATIARPSPAVTPVAPVRPQSQASPGAVGSAALEGDRPIASPAVRRRAWELGIDLRQVKASGTAGRIMQADLDAHVARQGTEPPVPHALALVGRPRTDQQAIPVQGLRRRIAVRMQEAKRRIPHFTYVEELDVSELEGLRAQLNAKWRGRRAHLTLLPFLVRAVALAVREFPQVNARFDDEAGIVTRHGAVHVGIATQTANGLMVPVVRHVEAMDIWSSAAEVARLADAARAGKATRDELSGSTITITSLGILGGIASTPVINPPEVAIVGVNRIVERPVLRGAIVVPRLLMNLSSSFDHRVVDGVDAAGFIQFVRSLLEAPAMLFVDAFEEEVSGAR